MRKLLVSGCIVLATAAAYAEEKVEKKEKKVQTDDKKAGKGKEVKPAQTFVSGALVSFNAARADGELKKLLEDKKQTIVIKPRIVDNEVVFDFYKDAGVETPAEKTRSIQIPNGLRPFTVNTYQYVPRHIATPFGADNWCRNYYVRSSIYACPKGPLGILKRCGYYLVQDAWAQNWQCQAMFYY